MVKSKRSDTEKNKMVKKELSMKSENKMKQVIVSSVKKYRSKSV